MRRLALLSLFVAAVFGAVATRTPDAEAHAVLVRSDPPAGATLDSAPKVLQLWFSEGLSRELTTVRLVDSEGKEVGPLQLTYNEADDRQVSAAVPELQKGTYTIAWSSFSTVDGHRLDGSVSFGVGVAPSGDSTTSSPDFRPSASEVTARWFNLIGALALGGVITVTFLLGSTAESGRDPRRLLMMLALVALGLLAAGDIAALLLRADRTGGIDEAGSVITGSTWGQLWLARMWLVAFAAAAVLAMLVSLRVWFWTRLAALGVIAGGVLLTESLSSHAATRTANLPVFADFVHLVASAAWIGTVLALPALILWSRRDPSGARRPSIVGAVRRFAFVAAGSFGLILITGIYRTVEEMPTLRSFVDTTYGNALTVKLALVLAVLVLGGTNFLIARRWDAVRSHRLWNAFSRTIPAEAMVGAAIVAAVGLMTIATPAVSLVTRAAGTAAKITSVVRDEQAAGDLLVELTVEPTSTGTQRITATVFRNANASSRDKPLTLGEGLDITQVRFRFKPLDSSIGESRIIAARTDAEDDDVYAAAGAFLPFQGRWEIGVDVRRKSEDDVSARFVIDTERDQRPAYAQVVPADKLFYSIARSSGDPALLLATGDGFYRSADAGMTWQQAQGKRAYRVVADPVGANAFLAAGPHGLLSTLDAGESWTPLYEEKGNTVFDAVVDARNLSVIVIATEQGIYRSGDRGLTWDLRLASAPPSGARSQPDEWTDLAAAPDGTIISGRRPGVIVLSRDGGLSWEESPAQLELPGGVMGLMIDPADARRWFVGSMGSGVWLSEDAGETWRQAESGVSPNGHGAGFDKTADGEYIVATTGQGVLRSTDGLTWSQLGDDRIELGIAEAVSLTALPDGQQAVIVAGLGIYRLELESANVGARP